MAVLQRRVAVLKRISGRWAPQNAPNLKFHYKFPNFTRYISANKIPDLIKFFK